LDIAAPAGTVTYGLVVGTDNTVESFMDYKMGSLISHGVGLGNLQYGLVQFIFPVNVAGTVSLIVTRIISNGSGAPITVKEAGIYCKQYGIATYYFCLVRDVLGAPVTINDGDSKLIEYILQTVN